jgi:DNA polymerase-3 subunit delta'
MTPVEAQATPLFWHEPAWQRLASGLREGRTPHALLIHGSSGLGKSRLAERLARAALCEERDESGDACGACRACRLAKGAHPDRFDLCPEEGKTTIGVDRVRDLIRFLSLSSQYGGYRVATIVPADRLTVAAANSLLKTLEEPNGDALLILVTDRPARLPVTVRSRCQSVGIPLPSRERAAAWLDEHAPEAAPLLGFAGGAPLAAIRAAEEGQADRYARLLEDLQAIRQGRHDPVSTAAQWQEAGATTVAGMLGIAIADMIRVRTVGRDGARSSEPDTLQALAGTLDLRSLYDYMDKVADTRRVLDQPLNALLVIESLFIDWRRATSAASAARNG